MNKIHSLRFPALEVPDKKVVAEKLFIDADEDHVALQYLSEKVELDKDSFVYDVGCGQGRHSIELARRGFCVTGVDYVKDNISEAKRKAAEEGLTKVQFEVNDCREYRNSNKADLCLCLYDVIGSYVDKKSNEDIIRSVYRLLKNGGKAFISVMNYEMTQKECKYSFVFEENPSELLKLRASETMQNTGEVFNPDYYMVDIKEHIVYRKEQFTNGQLMPVEMIVRDRRYSMQEIVGLCEDVGLRVLEKKYTHATSWNDEYEGTDLKAKEILLYCEKM